MPREGRGLDDALTSQGKPKTDATTRNWRGTWSRVSVPGFLPQGKVQVCEFELVPGLSSSVGHHPECMLISHPTQDTEVIGMAEWLGEAGSAAAGARNSPKGCC